MKGDNIRLAVTMGDPRGIGPEVCSRALAGGELPDDAGVTVVGSSRVLHSVASALNLRLDVPELTPESGALPGDGAAVLDLNNFPPSLLEPREPCGPAGRASLDYIRHSVELVKSGKADALVTGPINKEAVAAAGSHYPGHTEMLADLTGGNRPVMMLVNRALRVAFVTNHVALRAVPDLVSGEDIEHTARTLTRGLRQYFDVPAPRIAVCGLNPHCSDGGRFGDEEEKMVAPAVARMRRDGVDVEGPLPCDTVFSSVVRDLYDGIVALYHDQGMIPIKYRGIQTVTNVTLGLPIIRTSVGHGTAYDIAGKGSADETSLLEAMRLAVRMVKAEAPSKA